jgi:hypothetical protein
MSGDINCKKDGIEKRERNHQHLLRGVVTLGNAMSPVFLLHIAPFTIPEFHYLLYNSPPKVPILSQMNPIHSLASCFLKIYSNIILSSVSWSYKLCLLYRIGTRKFLRMCVLQVSPTSTCLICRNFTHYIWMNKIG